MFKTKYKYSIIENQREEFIRNWKILATILEEYQQGIDASDLDQLDAETYASAIKWQSQELWEKSGEELPDQAHTYRDNMQNCCSKIVVQYEMKVGDEIVQSEEFVWTNEDQLS